MPTPLAHPGALAGPTVDWASLRRVLVVRPDNLGDVVMTGPALRALRAAAPRAELILLASPAGAAAAPLLPEVDDVLVASPSWQVAGATVSGADDDMALVARVAGRDIDAAVVLTSFSQSPWPAATVLHLAGVPVRIGASTEFGGALLTHWVPSPAAGAHQVDRSLQILAAVGVAPQGHDLRVLVPVPARAAAGQALDGAGVGGPYAVVLPGASCQARRWAAEGFAGVAAALARSGRSVVVAGSGRESDLVAEVVGGAVGAGAGGRVAGLAGDLDVAALAALIGGADVAVVNNSGGAHLADAVRTPVVVLFAGTEEPAEYSPRSTRSVLLTRPVACSPCRQFRCPFDHRCLAVPTGEVAAAAVRIARGGDAPRVDAAAGQAVTT